MFAGIGSFFFEVCGSVFANILEGNVEKTCVAGFFFGVNGFLRVFSFVLLIEQRINNVIRTMPYKLFGFAIKFNRPTDLPLREVENVRVNVRERVLNE